MNKFVNPLYLSIIIVTILTSCFGAKEVAKSSEKTPPLSDIPKIEKVDSFTAYSPSRNFTIISSQAIENILEIEVSYSGGCAEHSFNLYTTGAYMKSLPPKLALLLIHDDGGDACRELKTEKLKFQLNNVQYEGLQTVQLIINNEHTVDYTY